MTTSIVFDHRGRTKKNEQGPLEVRIIIHRKVSYISTGIRIRESQYRYGCVINHEQADVLNSRLRIIQQRVEEELNRSIAEGCNVDIANLRKSVFSLTSEKKNKKDLLEWIDAQIPQLNIASGTRKHYKTVLAALYDYNSLASFDDLSIESIYRFDAWLHSRKKRQTQGDIAAGKSPSFISDAGVYKYHKILKALLNRALLFGLIQSNPYAALRGKFKRGEKESVEYLTEEEMTAFMSLRPTAGSQAYVARDLFIVQMYTGLAYTDMQNFDFSAFKLVNGEYRYIGTRVKTGTPFVGQLLPPVVEVLSRYGWKLPRMNNADYNHALKYLGAAAGISTPLHSHLARHTFATFMLRNGVRIEHVSKMLGHTNITQTQRYAKVLAESIHEDFSRISARFQ